MNFIENLLRAYLPDFIVKRILPDVATIISIFDKLEAKLKKHTERQTQAVLRNRHTIAQLEADTQAREADALRAMRVADKIKKLTD